MLLSTTFLDSPKVTESNVETARFVLETLSKLRVFECPAEIVCGVHSFVCDLRSGVDKIDNPDGAWSPT